MAGRLVYRKRQWPAWIAAGTLPVIIAIGWYLLPLGHWLGTLREGVVELGWLGVAAFVAVYTALAVLLAPGALLTIAAGFTYGFWAVPIVLIAATAGASLAFLAARHLVRNRVRRAIAERPDLAAIDRAIAAEGWKIVLLLRLSPIVPFGIQSYLFGVTAVPFRAYLIATVFGVLPGTAVFVTIGALGSVSVDPGLDPGGSRWVLLGCGLLAAIAAVVLVTRKAHALLRETGVAPASTSVSASEGG